MKFSHLPRIYTSEHIYEKQILIMEKDNFHYLKSVIRVRKSETFRLFNALDGEFLVTVKEINRASLEIEVGALIREIEEEKPLELALGVAGGCDIIDPDLHATLGGHGLVHFERHA